MTATTETLLGPHAHLDSMRRQVTACFRAGMALRDALNEGDTERAAELLAELRTESTRFGTAMDCAHRAVNAELFRSEQALLAATGKLLPLPLGDELDWHADDSVPF